MPKKWSATETARSHATAITNLHHWKMWKALAVPVVVIGATLSSYRFLSVRVHKDFLLRRLDRLCHKTRLKYTSWTYWLCKNTKPEWLQVPILLTPAPDSACLPLNISKFSARGKMSQLWGSKSFITVGKSGAYDHVFENIHPTSLVCWTPGFLIWRY